MSKTSKFQTKPLKTTIYLLGFLFTGVGAYLLLTLENSFPILNDGHYIGTISGISDSENSEVEKYSFYIECKKNESSMLLVAFMNNWRPQTIFLKENKTEKPSPIEIRHKEKFYSLVGKKAKNSFTGSVKEYGRKVGSWDLRKISESELLSNTDQNLEQANLTEWLKLKGKFYSVEQQKIEIQKEIKNQKKQITSLSKALEKKQLLTEKATEQIKILEEEIKTQSKEKKSTNSKLLSKVKNLEQLKRINKTGRAIDLARRVSKRETQWYLVNWGSNAGPSASMEENIARSMNIDYRKLKGKLARSEEYLRIKGEIESERIQIRDLEALALERSGQDQSINNQGIYDQDITQQPRSIELENTQAPAKEDKKNSKPWWKKWDSVL